MSDKDRVVEGGKYRHYKGNEYEVVGVAFHTETLEEFVIYRRVDGSCSYKDYKLSARPLDMFLETVEKDGKMMPRFEYLG